MNWAKFGVSLFGEEPDIYYDSEGAFYQWRSTVYDDVAEWVHNHPDILDEDGVAFNLQVDDSFERAFRCIEEEEMDPPPDLRDGMLHLNESDIYHILFALMHRWGHPTVSEIYFQARDQYLLTKKENSND